MYLLKRMGVGSLNDLDKAYRSKLISYGRKQVLKKKKKEFIYKVLSSCDIFQRFDFKGVLPCLDDGKHT